MKPFRKVDVSRPPKITVAIGLCISLPGKSPFSASGINARAELSAVIRIGFKRSIEPCRTALYSPKMRVMADQQHTVTSGNTEQGNETDNSRNTHLAGSQLQDEHAPDQRQR